MKIPWGSSSLTKMRLVIVAVVIFILVVLFWPQHTTYYFSVEPGQEYTVTFQGNDFEYDLFVHSINAVAGTAELSIFIPAYSAYYVPGGHAVCLEQNRAVTLQDFRVGETYRFEEGDNNVTLFKMTKVDNTQAVFSVLDSWLSDDPETQDIDFSINSIAQNESLTIVTDKAKYSQGETVNISITNDTDSDIKVCSALYRIGQLNYSDDRIEWRQLMLGATGYTANETFVLQAGESVSASWSQTEQVCIDGTGTDAHQVAPGQYRIEAIIYRGDHPYGVTGYIDSCYSVLPELPLDECGYSVITEIE